MTREELTERAVAARDVLKENGFDVVIAAETQWNAENEGDQTGLAINCSTLTLVFALEAFAEKLEARARSGGAPFPTEGAIDA